MKVSDRIADLRRYFPFSLGETTLRTQALSLGRCVKYETGETVLLSGSPAKHCGLILSGQAVAFKFDDNGRRYQLCLEEGCFVGLETLREESSYTSKIVAVTDLEILFWKSDGVKQLCDYSPEFSQGMKMLDDGRVYQEQWLVPETDIMDPVLCSLRPHWLSISAPVLLILLILFIALGICAMLIRRYLAAWLLVFAALAAAGTLLYRKITSGMNERIIATTKNLILVPENSDEDTTVVRLAGLQTIDVDRSFFDRLVNGGRIILETEKQKVITPSVYDPVQTANLIYDYSEIAALGRPIVLRVENKAIKNNPRRNENTVEQTVPEEVREKVDQKDLPPFQTAEFRAHWAMCFRMMFKPLLVLCTALYAIHYFRYHAYFSVIGRVLLVIAAAAAAGIVYQFFSWRNHRFFIEEDCVKDYSKRPFSKEDLNMAMNHKIQSVRYEKNGLFQTLLNYGTVYILAGEGELSFDYVSDPRHVQQLIMDTCNRCEAKRQLEEEARRRAYISDLVREIQNETAEYQQ